MSSEDDALVAWRKTHAATDEEKILCTRCLPVESKRVGSEDGRREKRGPREVKGFTLLKIPTAGIYFLADSILVFKERNRFLSAPVRLHGIYFFQVS